MNGCTNGVIEIYGFNESSNYISLRDLQNISIENVETRYTLGYCGYSCLGAYLVQTIWEKYYCKGTKLVDFSKESFKEWLIDEVVKAIEDTNSRISKKNKKKKVADKINDIENEIDLKIMDLVDSLASKGVKLQNTDRKWLPKSVSKEYKIYKDVKGYGSFHGPKMWIRKNLNGSYSVQYILTNSYSNGRSAWHDFKKDMTAEEIESYIQGYFKGYLEIPEEIKFEPDLSIYKGVKK